MIKTFENKWPKPGELWRVRCDSLSLHIEIDTDLEHGNRRDFSKGDIVFVISMTTPNRDGISYVTYLFGEVMCVSWFRVDHWVSCFEQVSQ